jgi:hypothetical protein
LVGLAGGPRRPRIYASAPVRADECKQLVQRLAFIHQNAGDDNSSRDAAFGPLGGRVACALVTGQLIATVQAQLLAVARDLGRPRIYASAPVRADECKQLVQRLAFIHQNAGDDTKSRNAAFGALCGRVARTCALVTGVKVSTVKMQLRSATAEN